MAASNAFCCANLALADYNPVIPLDEVIETAQRVGSQMPRELRCTALGGLSITQASRRLESELVAWKTDAALPLGTRANSRPEVPAKKHH